MKDSPASTGLHPCASEPLALQGAAHRFQAGSGLAPATAGSLQLPQDLSLQTTIRLPTQDGAQLRGREVFAHGDGVAVWAGWLDHSEAQAVVAA